MKMKPTKIIGRLIAAVIIITAVLLISRLDEYYASDRNAQKNNAGELIEVHFIDVGQGDSILVKTKDASMLIDAGENGRGTKVAEYLKDQDIDKLDYVIGTHPHSDHIGGLDDVLNRIPVDKVIMPKVVHTTKTYEDVLDAVVDNDLTITEPSVGAEFSLGPAVFTIVAPISSTYDDLNNYSIGIRLTYKDTSFLFAGDAEDVSEKEMAAGGSSLKADVLKLSHHGSKYSSSDVFLDVVRPSYAVISVGKNNDYGHPHESTLREMEDREIKVYRTDVLGTIIFISDGNTVTPEIYRH